MGSTSTKENFNATIMGDNGQRLALQLEGETMVPAAASRHSAENVVSTQDLRLNAERQLSEFREQFARKQIAYKAQREQAIGSLTSGTPTYARSMLKGLRQEQILIEGAAKKLASERDAALALCHGLAKLNAQPSATDTQPESTR